MGYLVIDAEGYYGDYATVYAAADDLAGIPRKYVRSRSTRVVSDGGYACDVGDRIHRADASHYHEVISYVLRVGDRYVHISDLHLTASPRDALTFGTRAAAEAALRDRLWTEEVDPGLIEIDGISAILTI